MEWLDEDKEEKGDLVEKRAIKYVCEDCDYRWITERNVEFNENYNGENAPFSVDDSKMACPICGSSNISRA